MVWSAIVGGALSLLGNKKANEANADINSANNAFNAEEAQKDREFQAHQADVTRNYQERLSNTQYQRATSDMQAAGLNPMLAYTQGGAGTPSGATPSGAKASAASPISMRDEITPALNSALKARQVDLQTENMKEQNELIRAQAFRERAEGYAAIGKPELMSAQTEEARSRIGLNEQTGRKVFEETAMVKETVNKIKAEIDNIKMRTEHEGVRIHATQALSDLSTAQEQYTRGQISIQQYEKRIKNATAQIIELGIPAAKQAAGAQEGTAGTIGAYLRALTIGNLPDLLRLIK